ncbi:MAG: hypothetical protein ACRD01_10965 [Terriglobales bacterium]
MPDENPANSLAGPDPNRILNGDTITRRQPMQLEQAANSPAKAGAIPLLRCGLCDPGNSGVYDDPYFDDCSY